jgi:hypothetical protein
MQDKQQADDIRAAAQMHVVICLQSCQAVVELLSGG